MSGLALDLAASKMYWSDIQAPPQIRWADLDGSNPAPLYVVTGTGKEPGVNDLEVDAVGGRLYWVESAYEKKTGKELLSIRSANLDGSDDETLVDQSGGRLNDLAVDGAAGVLYWAETVYCGKSGSRIMRSNLDGSDPTPVITGLGVLTGLEIVR